MIHPLRWIIQRPGLLIPVFFLCLVQARGQYDGKECTVISLGNTFLTRKGYCMARHNQAGLGCFSGRSLSLQHSRPGLCRDIGISSVSLQISTLHGGLGGTVTHYGISGLGYSSAWIAYGIEMYPGWSAGLGIHLWTTSIREKWFCHPGFSFAVGFQAQFSEKLSLAAHVAHPAGWVSSGPQTRATPMTIAFGGSWMPIPLATWYWELEFSAGYPVRWKLGLEWMDILGTRLQVGLHSQPFTVTGGIMVRSHRWNIQIAYAFRYDSGSTPSTALTYEWE